MKYTPALMALAATLALPAFASAQTVDSKTPADALVSALSLTLLQDGDGYKGDLDHMGSYNVYGGKVCMSSLKLTNDSTVQKQLDSSLVKTVRTGPSTSHASVVETLEPGESLNILDRGEAGDNVKIYRVVSDDPTEDTTLSLHGYGTVAGLSVCEAAGGTVLGVLFTAPGERLIGGEQTLTFLLTDDEAELDATPITDVFTVLSDGNGALRVSSKLGSEIQMRTFREATLESLELLDDLVTFGVRTNPHGEASLRTNPHGEAEVRTNPKGQADVRTNPHGEADYAPVLVLGLTGSMPGDTDL